MNPDRVRFGAIAQHHDQPPFDTPASRRRRARYVLPDTTIRDLFKWALAEGGLESLEITFEDASYLEEPDHD